MRKQDTSAAMNAWALLGIMLAETSPATKKSRVNPSGENAAEFRMTALDNRFESDTPLTDLQPIQDQGGARSGRDRRQKAEPFEGGERRSGRERRHGFDRRSGIERRRSSDRRNGRYFRDGEMVERRDAFRRRINEK